MIYDCCILADPAGKAWKFAYSVYEKLHSRDKKFHINEVIIKKFNDGEIKAKIKENIRKANCFFIHDSGKAPADWFLELALVNEAMKTSSAKEITDVLPYFKFCRQDRKDESRVSINGKVVADTISLYADRVITCELHSPQIQGFFDIPVDNLYSFPYAINYFNTSYKDAIKCVVVESPDVGGAVRARAFAKRLGLEEIVIGDKVRKEAGKVSGLNLIGDVKDKNVIIIDDIIDSGNTLIMNAEKIREEGGKKVYAYCTHGVFSRDAREKVSRAFDRVFVSDTIPQPDYPGIEVISLVDLFAEAIYRVNSGESLSELFE